jgi:hypothetical protein
MKTGELQVEWGKKRFRESNLIPQLGVARKGFIGLRY